MTLTQVKTKIEVTGVLAVQAVEGLFNKPVSDFPTELLPRVVEPPFACRVQEAMNIVVARAGADHHYTAKSGGDGLACRYVWGGKADCLIGQVLHQMGVSLAALSQVEGKPAHVALALLSRRGQIPGDPTTLELAQVGQALLHAQVINDALGTWGRAASDFRLALGAPC